MISRSWHGEVIAEPLDRGICRLALLYQERSNVGVTLILDCKLLDWGLASTKDDEASSFEI